MKIHTLVWQTGFLTGGLVAALYLLCYLFRLEWVLSPGLQVAHWSAAVVGTVWGLRGMRTEKVGFDSRGAIWRNALFMLLSASFVLLFLQILVHEALDPTLRDALAELQWEQMQEFLGAFGELPISEALMQDSLRSAWSWGGLVRGSLWGRSVGCWWPSSCLGFSHPYNRCHRTTRKIPRRPISSWIRTCFADSAMQPVPFFHRTLPT